MSIKTDSIKTTRQEKREAFRVDDALPVVIQKVEDQEAPLSSEPVMDLEEFSRTFLEKENINPYLWEVLINLHKKLDRILERLPVDLMRIKDQPVNLSSTGMKIKVKKDFNLDEKVRIKMLLSSLPVKEIIIAGKIVRVTALAEGEYEVALHFQDLDEEVRNEIIQYTLNQQRKAILAQRQQKGTDESSNQKDLGPREDRL